jgi:hypothetical protein
MATRARISAGTLCLLLLFLPSAVSWSANITASLELLTHGYLDSGFKLKSFGQLDLAVDGGYKFGGRIGLALRDTSFEDASPGSIVFDSVNVGIRELFRLPLDLSFFIGGSDVLCGGDAFAVVFGTEPIGTDYRGLMYFPTLDLQSVYNGGIHAIRGTGVKIDFAPKRETMQFSLYGYEDTAIAFGGALGCFSGDLRFLGNFGAFAVEGFAGATYAPSSSLGYYRGGVLVHTSYKNLEVLAQAGIPKYDPSSSSGFGIELFYLLFEPSLHLGLFSIVPTFFWHPGAYLQADTPDQRGAFDVNLNLFFGDLVKTSFRAGLESNFNIQSSTGVFEVNASPYVGFTTPGVLWTVRLNVKVWPFLLADMVDGFVGLRAEL